MAERDSGKLNEREPARSIRLIRLNVPLRRAHDSRHGSEQLRDVVLVEWTDKSGSVGWGECSTLSSPGYVTETTDEAWSALVTTLAPAAVAGEEPKLQGVVAALSSLRDAALDARLRSAGKSLCEHLGAVRRPLARCVVLARHGSGPEVVVEQAERALREGAALVKVKIGGESDETILRSVVDAVGSSLVAADANGYYRDFRDLAGVDRLGLRYLEQPFDPSISVSEMAVQVERLNTPVALDESLRSVDDLDHLASTAALEVVSVKPQRVGGVVSAAAMVSAAVDRGLDVFVGGMLEMGIGRASALAVASLPGCGQPTDLGPSDSYFDRDVCSPVTLDENGLIQAPSGPGLGVEPDEDVVDAYTVAEARFSR